MLTLCLSNTGAAAARSLLGGKLDERAKAILANRVEIRHAFEITAQGQTGHPSVTATLKETDADRDSASRQAVQEPIEVDARDLRIAGVYLAFEVGRKTQHVPVAEIAWFRIDGGPRRVLMLDGLVDGPLRPNLCDASTTPSACRHRRPARAVAGRGRCP